MESRLAKRLKPQTHNHTRTIHWRVQVRCTSTSPQLVNQAELLAGKIAARLLRLLEKNVDDDISTGTDVLKRDQLGVRSWTHEVSHRLVFEHGL